MPGASSGHVVPLTATTSNGHYVHDRHFHSLAFIFTLPLDLKNCVFIMTVFQLLLKDQNIMIIC